MQRISKQKARKLYNSGAEITLIAHKLMYGAPWYPECPIQHDGDVNSHDFNTMLNSFIYYNCCYETGYYPHYYI